MSDGEVTENQILGAKIRAEEERWVKKHRKPLGGGWLLPPTEEKYAHLSNMFNMPPHVIRRYMTYTRYCDHPWSAGACPKCPK